MSGTIVDGSMLGGMTETSVTQAKLKKLIEYWEEYNLNCRLFRQFDQDGVEIPLKYRGRKRYHLQDGVALGPDGEYTQYYLFDMDPEDPNGKVHIAVYVVTDPTGSIRLQTDYQIQKHIKAAQLEFERQRQMELSRPDLARTKLDVKLPRVKRPMTGKKQLAERITNFSIKEEDPTTILFEGRKVE